MASIKHATQATKPQRNDKEVSRNAWNEDHAITGTPDTVLGFDGAGNATDVALSGLGGLAEAVNRAALAALTATAEKGAFLKENNKQGVFIFDDSDLSTEVAADPTGGVYVAPTAEDGTNGAWVRVYVGDIDARWFGTGSAALVAAQNYVASLGHAGITYNVGVPRIRVPFDIINFTAPFDVVYPVHWIGESNGGATGAGTVLQWNNTSNGLRIQYVDTVGDAGTQAPVAYSGSGSIFEGFHLDGGYTNGDEAERHAVLARAKVHLINCSMRNWAGDAVKPFASTVGAMKGNANLVKLDNCWAENCRSGWHPEGNDDTNAGHMLGFSSANNRRCGILEASFLGNQVIGGHLDHNARLSWNTGLPGRPCSYVSHGGNHYFCIHGQEAWASANAPSGTTADNQGWGYWRAGGVDAATGVPAWFAGIEVRSGGPIIVTGANNATTIFGPHIEDNGVSQIDQLGFFFGGPGTEDANGSIDMVRVTSGAVIRNRLARIRATSDGIRLGGNAIVAGALYAQGVDNFVGPKGSTVTDATTHFRTRNVSHDLSFEVVDASGTATTNIGTLSASSGLGYIFNLVNAAHAYRFRINGSDRIFVDNSGVTLSGTGHTINGQVTTVVDTSSLLELGRYSAGIPSAIIRPNATATDLVIRSPDNTNKITVSNTGVVISGNVDLSGGAYSIGGVNLLHPREQNVVSAATVTPTFSNDQVNITAQAAALALANPTGTAVPSHGITIRIKDNGTARAITYDTQYRAIGVTLPTTTVINKTLYIGMIFNAADTKWDVVSVAQEA
jgi:hypothetical protein